MKSDIVLRIEKALKEYTPSKIDGVRIATARGILTAYEIAVLNGLNEAGKVDCIKSTVSDFKSPNGHNLVGDVNYYVVPSDTFKQLEKLGLLDEVPPHIGFITAHEGRYSKLRLITKKAATKVTPAVDKYMLAWSAVKGRYINSSVSNKKVNSAAIVECKGFKVRERQI